ncbi:dipeptide ABC transporter ATP binding subunit DppD [Rhodovastum atsumiense]|uniref:ABC transporter ATP-binding protein n=1 Tax=Rhodovastum atsumiense TaxID=504468 RepID=A0A5M6J4Q7_9PROT|nr:ABC transporter ATP-binding protein [Rhodovastum atsumiense]KAA5614558.1 ABC transporter ATP-binding protein [Rhodovastum atsumiense]CAH2599953.1 dipeptide ABC transporter ATP binding subunit DppD [Rhodovastum atsumiense]
MALLEIRGLRTWFRTEAGMLKAVDGVDLTLERGETLALVGESGSGKSVTACSLLRLVEPAGGRIAGGEVLFRGTDLLRLDAAGIRAVRGDRIAMIFQEPLSALNPVQTIGAQIVEALRLHRRLSRRAAWKRAMELLALVQIPSPHERAREFPHRLSGGMRQRAMIAMALACEPELLIADEPTTALDVTTQVQILALLRDLQRRLGMGLLLITHDLGVVAEVADRVAVMYAGRVVEEGPVDRFFAAPAHPYARGLLDAVRLEALAPGSRLPEIPGMVPSLVRRPPGCAFAPRCARVSPRCEEEDPVLRTEADGCRHACFNPHRGDDAGQAAA